MGAVRFHKYQAAGNDYLVLEARGYPPSDELVRRLCDRRLGLGSDGVLFEADAPDGAFGLRIVNPDGSPAAISGNGLRIFARYLFDGGRVGGAPFTVRTPSKPVRCRVLDGGATVEVEMGRASFRSRDVPVAGPDREVVDEPLEVGATTFRYTAVSMGNPHAVIPVQEAGAWASRWGPMVERHPAFPDRVNVQFAQVESRGRVRVQVWERGAGLTLASGSSACAVAAALRRSDACDATVDVIMAGGTLRVELSPDYDVTLRGPVAAIASGVVAPDLLAAPKVRPTHGSSYGGRSPRSKR